MSTAPVLVFGISALLGATSKKFIVGGPVSLQCDGWLLRSELWSVPGYSLVKGMPYLVVVPAFLVWLGTRRHAAGWAVVAVLGPVALAEPLLFGFDVARRGQICVRAWFLFGDWQIFWWTYGLFPVVLVLAAICRPRAGSVRPAIAAALVIGMLFSVASDQERPRLVAVSPDDCRNGKYTGPAENETVQQEVAGLSQRERETTYLCLMRGYSRGAAALGSTPRDPFDGLLSDGDLLRAGRRACRGDQRAPVPGLPRRAIPRPSLRELAYLCPETAAARVSELRRSEADRKAEFARAQVKADAQCRQGLVKGPRPVRQATRAVTGNESSSYSVGVGGGMSFDAAVRDGLVAAVGDDATVTTGTEGTFCVTVRAYRKAPPLALEGWERVAEVGFDSADGQARVESFGGPMRLPVVTAAGPGPYRLRVHVRGRGAPETFSPEPPVERHLLVVFPGRSKKPELFKNEER